MVDTAIILLYTYIQLNPILYTNFSLINFIGQQNINDK